MKTSWTCKAGTQLFDVVTTTHVENRWVGVLFVCLFVHMITQSIYPINPPNLQVGGEKDVEGPKRYIDL